MVILKSSALYGSAINVENIEINEHDQQEDKIIDSITPEDLNPNIGFSCHIACAILKRIGYQFINNFLVHLYIYYIVTIFSSICVCILF